MFRCDVCSKAQPSGTKPIKKVTAVRIVTYPVIKDDRGNVVKTPVGSEIAKEIKICQECSISLAKKDPILVGSKDLN